MKIKLQSCLLMSSFSLMLAAGALPAWAQTPPPDDAPPPPGQVRVCDDTGCSYRSKDAISTETVDDDTDREDPSIAKLKQIAQTEPKAAHDLGLRYFRGDGVRQDSYQALDWMRKAAERGNLQAQKALGAFYLYGLQEMGPDPQEAEKWLSMAAGRGDKESEKLLTQARAAKKSEQEDFKAREDRREERRAAIYYGYWNSGYRYYGTWNQSRWYGY